MELVVSEAISSGERVETCKVEMVEGNALDLIGKRSLPQRNLQWLRDSNPMKQILHLLEEVEQGLR